MGRIRTIKPEFFKHSGLFDLEQKTGLPLRVAFSGLWTIADREGRFKWRPREIKVDAFPYDDCEPSHVLDALVAGEFIVKYACGSGEFGYIPSWKSHQFINNREAASTLPNPESCQLLDARPTRDSRDSDALTTCPVRKGRERKGRERKSSASLSPLEFPEWFPTDTWDGFVAMRQKIRAPLTDDAQKKLLKKLIVWHSEGIDVAAALDKSIECSYRGVWPDEKRTDGAPRKLTDREKAFAQWDEDIKREKENEK
jgi:hypothetical protein